MPLLQQLLLFRLLFSWLLLFWYFIVIVRIAFIMIIHFEFVSCLLWQLFRLHTHNTTTVAMARVLVVVAMLLLTMLSLGMSDDINTEMSRSEWGGETVTVCMCVCASAYLARGDWTAIQCLFIERTLVLWVLKTIRITFTNCVHTPYIIIFRTFLLLSMCVVTLCFIVIGSKKRGSNSFHVTQKYSSSTSNYNDVQSKIYFVSHFKYRLISAIKKKLSVCCLFRQIQSPQKKKKPLDKNLILS